MSQPLPKYTTAARFERSTVDMSTDLPILERSDLVLAFARAPYVTYSRHLFTSAEDLVHCSQGHHAKLKNRKAPQAGVETPDRKGQRRQGTRHSPNLSPAAGSQGGPGKGRSRPLFVSGFLRNREH